MSDLRSPDREELHRALENFERVIATTPKDAFGFYRQEDADRVDDAIFAIESLFKRAESENERLKETALTPDESLAWDEMEGTLVDVAQLLDGWHQDGTAWSEWDESVRKRVSLELRTIDILRQKGFFRPRPVRATSEETRNDR